MKKRIKNSYKKYYLCVNPFLYEECHIIAKSMSDAAGLFNIKLGNIYNNAVRQIIEIEPNRFIILQYSSPQKASSHPLAFEVREIEEKEKSNE